MKKVVAILLCVAMLVTGLSVLGSATQPQNIASVAKADLQGAEAEYPIVFVTGIGQSNTYLYDSAEAAQKDAAANTTENSTAHWNLLHVELGFSLDQIGTYVQLLRVAGGLIGSLLTGHNIINEDAAAKLVQKLFYYNTVDSNGNLPDNLYTPRYDCSVADMTEDQKDIFYSRIPCKEVLGSVSEKSLYVFNYSAFSFTYNNAESLSQFINEVVLPQTGKSKVVLVPMSMGASVVEAYLQTHGTDGKVAKVVSIVGAWYGSDIIADLVEKKYAVDAPEKLYNGIVSDLVGEPWGYLVNVILRAFPKATLRSIIDTVVGAIDENLIYKTPSLMVMIPYYRYQAIRDKILSNNPDLKYVLDQTDKFYQAQFNLESIVKDLNENHGVEFYYIAGYGLEFGGYSSDYEFFQFMESANTVNSDEIIGINSTATGATYVKPGTQFDAEYLKYHDSKYISTDKSVDVSTCFFPDRVWLFQGQKHELENNNTALKIAFELALGNIHSVDECTATFPQFNESRDVKKLRKSYMPDLEKWLTKNTPTAEQQALIEQNNRAANAMLAETHNNRTADDKVIQDYYNMLVNLGVYNKPAEQSGFEKTMGSALKGLNDKVYSIFGAKGFVDILK